MPISIARHLTAVTGGVIDDIERDDDSRGYEAEDAARRLDAWPRARTVAAQRRLGDYVHRRLVDAGGARAAVRAAAGMRGAA
ncbi:hypothetical protein M8I34_32310 [Streptomyces sp. MCA2]|uniref:hypothetical protein n=1 Tax=Streptomyces sp. MCA2 TaxID=2944805 RepID=UPI0020203853|nr:hypothetical protein [Streptomyces sp. MCA2]MCL7496053.1 hypothetical protein [Streptomyces sp. MCA2]